jgi:hypothetical protein
MLWGLGWAQGAMGRTCEAVVADRAPLVVVQHLSAKKRLLQLRTAGGAA